MRSIVVCNDSRAIQPPVMSGNGRTMAGELAAVNGTGTACIDRIYRFPRQSGFTPEHVRTFKHPHVLFLFDGESFIVR